MTSPRSATTTDASAATRRAAARGHLRALEAELRALSDRLDELEDWGRELAGVLRAGGKLLTVGNGGSAAHAEHLAAEVVGRYREPRGPYSAIALTSDGVTLSALVNDYGAEEMFARQVSGLGRPGDVLIALSTSGQSANVVQAAASARAIGLEVWSLVGPRSSPLAELSSRVLDVPAERTATVQEVHQVAIHLLCAAFDEHLRTGA